MADDRVVYNGVLVHAPLGRDERSRNTLALSRAQFVAAITKAPGVAPPPEPAGAVLNQFLGIFEAPASGFGLVTPRE